MTEDRAAGQLAGDDTEGLKEAKAGYDDMQRVIVFLNEHYIGDSNCDGSMWNCACCDAVRLRLELQRFCDLVAWTYRVDFNAMQAASPPTT